MAAAKYGCVWSRTPRQKASPASASTSGSPPSVAIAAFTAGAAPDSRTDSRPS